MGVMDEHIQKVYANKWFDRVYKIGVAIKGFDGAVELLAGLGLWLAPGVIHSLLDLVGDAAQERTGHAAQQIAEYVGRLDASVTNGSLTFVIFFLIFHGVIKLGLVYCLLRKIVIAYPMALLALCMFLVYQVYALITEPGPLMAVLTVLDVLIIILVYGEYRKLLSERTNSRESKSTPQ